MCCTRSCVVWFGRFLQDDHPPHRVKSRIGRFGKHRADMTYSEISGRVSPRKSHDPNPFQEAGLGKKLLSTVHVGRAVATVNSTFVNFAMSVNYSRCPQDVA